MVWYQVRFYEIEEFWGNMETKRITWVDMAKGYGIIAVFIGHLVQGGMLGNFVYSFHLPLFFFLSGYLFHANVDFLTFLKKKARSILVPYFSLGIFIVFFTVYRVLWAHFFTEIPDDKDVYLYVKEEFLRFFASGKICDSMVFGGFTLD